MIATWIFVLLLICSAAGADEAARSNELTIAAVGDLMLGHRAEPVLRDFGPHYPFAEVMPVLAGADVVVGNLESPISTRGTAVPNKKFTLRAGPIAAAALKTAGIRVVTLANNHSMDFGPLALQDTLRTLDEHGILYTGAGMDLDDARAPAILTVRGRKIAFLSYSLTFPVEFYASANRPGTAPGYADYVRTDITRVRPAVDLIVVSFHWGGELLTAAKDYQIELGRKALDWGADAVLGHHPHVLQELESYHGKLIAYSLGNFVFGSESERTNTSMILLLTFDGRRLARAEAVPLDVNNYRVKYRPAVLTGKPAIDVLEAVNAGSARFNTRLAITGDRGTLVFPAGETASRPLQTGGTSTVRETTAAAPDSSLRSSSASGAP